MERFSTARVGIPQTSPGWLPHPAWPIEQIVDYIRKESVTHFDPRVVDAFFVRFDRIRVRSGEPFG